MTNALETNLIFHLIVLQLLECADVRVELFCQRGQWRLPKRRRASRRRRRRRRRPQRQPRPRVPGHLPTSPDWNLPDSPRGCRAIGLGARSAASIRSSSPASASTSADNLRRIRLHPPIHPS